MRVTIGLSLYDNSGARDRAMPARAARVRRYNADVRVWWTAGLVLAGAIAASAQAIDLARPRPLQHVTIVPGVSGTPTPGATLTLWVDVTPKPGLRVYAAGARDFTPVALVMTPHAAVTPRAPHYPPSVLDPDSGSPQPVPVYRGVFRITQPVTVSRTAVPGTAITLAAALNYQACDDRLCYPATSIPVLWPVTIR